jgi:hypothetical protein
MPSRLHILQTEPVCLAKTFLLIRAGLRAADELFPDERPRQISAASTTKFTV